MTPLLEHPRRLEPTAEKTFYFGQGRVNVLFETEPVACGLFTLEKDAVGSLDVHERAVELLWVLRGTLEYQVGQDRFVADAGSGLARPPPHPHTARNVGEGEAQVFWAFVPNDH